MNACLNRVKISLASEVRYPVASALVATVKFTKISDLSKIPFLNLDDFGWCFAFLDLAEI